MRRLILSLISVFLLCLQVRSEVTVYMEPGNEITGEVVRVGVATISVERYVVKVIPIARVTAIQTPEGMRNGPFDSAILHSFFPAAALDTAHVVQAPPVPLARADSIPVAPKKEFVPLFQREKGFHLSVEGKPFNIAFGNSTGDDKVPYPMRIAVICLRPYGPFGIEYEPQLILGGRGGWGFLAGPILFTQGALDGEPFYSFAFKYDYMSIRGWGPQSRFQCEAVKHIAGHRFLLGLGVEAGAGLTGLSTNPNRPILTGPFLGGIFDVGFGLM